MSARWRVVKHSWAETSLLDEGGSQVCLLSIRGEATEETQDDLERRTAKRAKMIAAAPDLAEALKELLDALRIHAPGTDMNNHKFDALGIKCHDALTKAGAL